MNIKTKSWDEWEVVSNDLSDWDIWKGSKDSIVFVNQIQNDPPPIKPYITFKDEVRSEYRNADVKKKYY